MSDKPGWKDLAIGGAILEAGSSAEKCVAARKIDHRAKCRAVKPRRIRIARASGEVIRHRRHEAILGAQVRIAGDGRVPEDHSEEPRPLLRGEF